MFKRIQGLLKVVMESWCAISRYVQTIQLSNQLTCVILKDDTTFVVFICDFLVECNMLKSFAFFEAYNAVVCGADPNSANEDFDALFDLRKVFLCLFSSGIQNKAKVQFCGVYKWKIIENTSIFRVTVSCWRMLDSPSFKCCMATIFKSD